MKQINATIRRVRRLRIWLAGLLLSWGGYLLLAGSTSTAQIVAGGLLATACLGVAAVFSGTANIELELRAGWIRHAIGMFLANLMFDTWLVTRALLLHLFVGRQLRGHYRHVTLAAGGSDALSRGRRAVILFAVSWTPNTYAVARDRGDLLLHDLVRRRKQQKLDAQWPR